MAKFNIGQFVLTPDMARKMLAADPTRPIPVKGFADNGAPHGSVGLLKEVTNERMFYIHSGKTAIPFKVGKVSVVKSKLSIPQLETALKHFEDMAKKEPEVLKTAAVQRLQVLHEEASKPAAPVTCAAAVPESPGMALLRQLLESTQKLAATKAEYRKQISDMEQSIELLREEERITVADISDTIELLKLDINDSQLAQHGLSLSTVAVPAPAAEPTPNKAPGGLDDEAWDGKRMKKYLRGIPFVVPDVKRHEQAKAIVQALPPRITFKTEEIADAILAYCPGQCSSNVCHHLNKMAADNVVKKIRKGFYAKVV